MIHVYKHGTAFELDGKKYDIACINEKDKGEYLSKGWVLSLNDVKKPRKKRKAISDDD